MLVPPLCDGKTPAADATEHRTLQSYAVPSSTARPRQIATWGREAGMHSVPHHNFLPSSSMAEVCGAFKACLGGDDSIV